MKTTNKTREQMNVDETSFEIPVDKRGIYVTEHAVEKYREFSKHYLGREVTFRFAMEALRDMVWNSRPHDIIVRQWYNGNTILLLPHTDEHLILNLDPHPKFKEEGVTIQVLTHVSRSRNRFVMQDKRIKRITDRDIENFREDIEAEKSSKAMETFVEMMAKPTSTIDEKTIVHFNRDEKIEFIPNTLPMEAPTEKQEIEPSLYAPIPHCGRCHKPIKNTKKQQQAYELHRRCLSCVGKKNAYALKPRSK